MLSGMDVVNKNELKLNIVLVCSFMCKKGFTTIVVLFMMMITYYNKILKLKW